ncbi:MAG: NADP-dependent oxidoreductase [Acidobacteriaceae bacterium]
MKAVVLHAYGPSSNLHVEDVAAPTVGPNQVLIEVHAAGINPIDWKMRGGEAREIFPVEFPAILGFDVAGVVRSCDEGVTAFAPGDRVFGRAPKAYAELVAADVSGLAKIPDGVDFNTAAALPVIATTADQLIVKAANTKAGQTILLTGALGSVGRLALYRALELGATVIAGVRATQIDEALALGAQQAIDITDDASLRRVGTVDAVADCIGGDLAPKLLTHVKSGGNYGSIVGPPRGAELHPSVHINAFGSQPDPAAMVHFAEAIRDGKFKLPIDLVLPLSEAAEGHAKGERGGIGKIILTP